MGLAEKTDNFELYAQSVSQVFSLGRQSISADSGTDDGSPRPVKVRRQRASAVLKGADGLV